MILSALIIVATLTFPNGHCFDADSCTVDGIKYRLAGVDSPEIKQTCEDKNGKTYLCGIEARNYLAGIIGNNNVNCIGTRVDRYKRVIAVCYAGQINLNEELLKSGWAIPYYDYPISYAAMSLKAQQEHKGIFQGTFEQPAQFRRNKGKK